ncbi:isochorismatase family protein [Streptomyces sp. NPDC005827]|uniref:isochorismatase family protein n=1 Tax=Streptomyces sp. NPDC005827 TaxID=3157070 RepID=UPI00340CE614
MSTPSMRDLVALPAPEASVLLLIDCQPLQYLYSHDPTTVSEAVLGLAAAAEILGVPTVLTTLAEEHNGLLVHPLQDIFAGHEPIDRPLLDCWADPRVTDAVLAAGRKNLIIAGMHTETSVCIPALRAVSDGLDVYVVTDACGGVTIESHEGIVRHMARSGVFPVSWEVGGAAWLRERDRRAATVSADAAGTRATTALRRPSSGRVRSLPARPPGCRPSSPARAQGPAMGPQAAGEAVR